MADKLATVRKLLAKADADGVTEAEREAIIDKAADMIADHGIEEALLFAKDSTSDEIRDQWFPVEPPFAREVALLLHCTASPYGIRTYWTYSRDDDDAKYLVHLIGYGKDIERARVLFASLMLQAGSGLARSQPVGNLAAYQRNWLKGFATAIYTQLTEAESRAADRASTGTPGTALVLRDRRHNVDAAFEALHPNVGTGRAISTGGPGSTDGYRAGRQADLGGNRLGGERKGIR